ncbi:MAG: hypothetical protein NZ920_04255 [Aigarchaeota archaeon]|nr:hypothetical protein [Aigarchaeota archaeon]MDW8092166.1 hypothetical protein [Nitrososphaerota archaeon]
MYPGLVISGLITLTVGAVVMIAGFTIFVLLTIFGLLMVIWGLLTEPREDVAPSDPTKKFCWYCMEEIDGEETRCPYCGIRQYKETKGSA